MIVDRSTEAREKLIQLANLFIGVVEKTGKNDGPLIELFQRAVDGKALGEPYCLGFVHFLCQQVDEEMASLYPNTWRPYRLKRTEACVALIQDVPAQEVARIPFPGGIVVWRHWERNSKGLWNPTMKGHAGVCVEGGESFETIEANTSPPADKSGKIVREGDGIWPKQRSIHTGEGPMRYLGTIDPWKF